MLFDTHPDAEAVLSELPLRMTPAMTLKMVSTLSSVVVVFSRQGIRDGHPGIADHAVDVICIERN
jgi:hypothetical protein